MLGEFATIDGLTGFEGFAFGIGGWIEEDDEESRKGLSLLFLDATFEDEDGGGSLAGAGAALDLAYNLYFSAGKG